MKHILSCSFGKDSIATALLALQHGEPLDELVYCEVMFSEEISGELPEHNRFIHELQDVPNKPTERFSWRRTFREIDERFLQEGEQLSFYEER